VYVARSDGSEARRLVGSDAAAVYASGHLVFARQGDLFAQAQDSRIANVDAIPFDRTLARIIEPLHEFYQARFAAAALADQRDNRPFGYPQVDMLKYLFLIAAIAERNVLERDGVLQRLQYNGAGFLRQRLVYIEYVPDISRRGKRF